MKKSFAESVKLSDNEKAVFTIAERLFALVLGVPFFILVGLIMLSLVAALGYFLFAGIFLN